MIRVMIVDDEILLRTCMQRILECEPDIEVPVVCDGRDVLEAVDTHRPDVVLLDLRMPDVDGLTALQWIRSRPAPPTVAILTMFLTDEDIAAALRSGAAGFLMKDATPQELAHVVRVLAAGDTVLSAAAARIVIDGYLDTGMRHDEPDPRLGTLTEREHQVLELLAEGLTNAEIGRHLLLSASTAKEHVSTILTKLGLTNRVQAAVVAHRAAAARRRPLATPPRPAERSGEPGAARGGSGQTAHPPHLHHPTPRRPAP
ncbi:DNA-binding response regulator [Streptomyces chrestomyceticus JCM 4735]|uniref:DNA-binding response regulator n=1 Tax=Streptomyces chrestomyceticus JCM 4735 TaxID=1306181 RepID=A0A7U9PVH8_9ACTN|nr:response regulator transcription factor [Streptomyces chrestomyceticus]GCD32320.1 DNA-binding response regulator [Streptomyces chrestomyceticus JCM 4735]